ncbi:MAG: sugar ABC transporter permease [Oscillospiraceae bacterium]|jgi:multiple sugar transport system permease protein|nr:sugar ABC transporter permease [Oscillospiraceae bacterium]
MSVPVTNAPEKINSKKPIDILKLTGILYILFAVITAAVAIIHVSGINILREFMPQGFVFLNAVRNYALPAGVMPYFFYFLFIFSAFRVFLGYMSIKFRTTPDKGKTLGFLGKIDLWIVIPLTVFSLFFFDGFGFMWFPILSYAPTMLLLSGSAKLDNRPGRAAREESRTAKIFLIPAFLGLTFMTYIPLTAVFGISLFNWHIPFAPEFAGFRNLIDLFSEGSFFWGSVWLTVIYAFLAVFLGLVYSMIIALLLNRKIPGRVFFRTAFYLPFIIPVVSSMLIFRLIYAHNGVINNIINMFGGERVHFLFENATIIPAIAMIAVWMSGNIIVIKMAGLANIPRSYLESAEVDGANAWHRFWKITIPCMSPIIFYNMLMSLITNMQVVIPSLMLTSGGQSGATVIPRSFRFIAYELYMTAFSAGQLGRAAAISFGMFVLIGILTAILFLTSRKWLFYEGGGPA